MVCLAKCVINIVSIRIDIIQLVFKLVDLDINSIIISDILFLNIFKYLWFFNLQFNKTPTFYFLSDCISNFHIILEHKTGSNYRKHTFDRFKNGKKLYQPDFWTRVSEVFGKIFGGCRERAASFPMASFFDIPYRFQNQTFFIFSFLWLSLFWIAEIRKALIIIW